MAPDGKKSLGGAGLGEPLLPERGAEETLETQAGSQLASSWQRSSERHSVRILTSVINEAGTVSSSLIVSLGVCKKQTK